MTSVEIYITLGHRASQKARPSEEGFTHDWTVFVKGDEGNAIENFVEKVVFNLHQSFPKPKRVFKEPPFEVSESGYAGFIMPIDIFFKNKNEPKKITYEYDIYLRVNDSVANTRKEKLTFLNPSEDFMKKLIKSGGKVSNDSRINGSSSLSETASFSKNRSISNLANNHQLNNHLNNSTASLSTNVGSSGNTSNQLATIRNKNVIPSKDKSQQQHLSAASNSPSQLKSRDEYNNRTTKDKHYQQAKHSEFANLFGTPIQAKSKQKEIKSKKSKSSSEKSNNSRSSTPTSTISSNQLISSKEHSDSKKNKRSSSKESKLNKSNSSNSSSNSHQSRSLLQKVDKLNKIKKELDLPSSLPNKIKSPNSTTSKYDEKNHHSKISGNLSSSASSLNSIEENKIKKKRKLRSDSVSSNDSFKSTHSALSSASSSASSIKSNASRVSSNRSLVNNKQQSKKRMEHNSSDKKNKDQSGSSLLNSTTKKKESNIGASRILSSSLSSINSDYKVKEELKKSKDKSNQKLKDNSKDKEKLESKSKDKDNLKNKSKDKPKDELKDDDLYSNKKNGDEDELKKKEHKEKRKHKDDENFDKKKYKSSKKNKSSEPSKDDERISKKHKSSKDEKIIKEKNKDSIHKQKEHKEHNLKKEEITSTRFSFSNNNSTGLTTFEITSVKNVKMLQSESKKSKQHQDQSLNLSDKRSIKIEKSSSHYSSPLIKNNYEETPTSSPCFTNDDYSKTQKLNENYEKIMSDMRKKREISPLSPDLNSELNFNMDYQSNDEENSAFKTKYYDELNENNEKVKKFKKEKSNNSYLDESESNDELEEDDYHFEYVNDLILLQKQINELKDKELLNEIVQIVRESGEFKMNGKLFDFDLLKLDKKIIKKVKLCFS